MACRDLIEPKLHSLEVHGLPTTEDGAGVVVFRVNGGSPFGPHRHRGTKECYIRRNDETQPMDMVEVQRRSVELEKRLSRVDDELIRFRSVFLGQVYPAVTSPAFGIQACAVPTGNLLVPNIHRLNPARPSITTSVPVTFTGGGITEAQVPVYGLDEWRPVLRGGHAMRKRDNEIFVARVWDDCRVALDWSHHVPPDEGIAYDGQVFAAWFAGAFCCVLLSIERVRTAAGATSAEFALQFTYAASQGFRFADYLSHRMATKRLLPQGEHVFPRYSVGPAEEFATLARLFDNDVSNFVGMDNLASEPIYNFEPSLAAIREAFSGAA
jgi:hypothetical protein